MPGEASTPGSPPGTFILPIHAESREIGGKARSLARLAALGLPIPPAFVVGRALWLALRAPGPPLSGRLGSAADLAALDAARDALLGAAFPAQFERELQRALDVAERTLASPAGRSTLTFAVRSSGDTEDRSGSLGAGIHASLLRISRVDVPDAIRQVLASFLTPAAWAYRTRRGTPNARGALEAAPGVLIHPFVDGDAAGTAALGTPLSRSTRPPSPPTSRSPSTPRSPSSLSDPGAGDVRIEITTGGPLTAAARAAIEAATSTAAGVHGPIEIEWVATKDAATFLQLRGYRPAPRAAAKRTEQDGTDKNPLLLAMDPALPGGPWTWDAAHNPLPLSPAQKGLVEMVDACCPMGVRQRVIGGYLFFRATATDGVTASRSLPRSVNARAAFDQLLGVVEPELNALGPEPSLAVASKLFVSAYGPLFGVIGPACVTERRALMDFMASRFPDRARDLPRLFAGVGSVAQSRRAAADTIARATTVSARQQAIDAYLHQFGDESPRWDVAEPTLGETPDRLVAWTARQSDRQISPQSRDPDPDFGAARAAKLALELRDGLPPSDQAHFEALVASARAAIGVGEDDDALFARLQAAMRRALLAVGRRLAIAGRLNDADDVFYLPLSVVRAIDDGDRAVTVGDTSSSVPDSIATQDLRLLAAEGRRAFEIAGAAPPPVPNARTDVGVLRGQGGSGGRIVGRVVHHPAFFPLGPESVLVAATLLPTELPLLAPGGIVVETGQPLGHVAAQARERGIPAVVGAAGAKDALREGALIIVDGDRGEVVLLNEP